MSVNGCEHRGWPSAWLPNRRGGATVRCCCGTEMDVGASSLLAMLAQRAEIEYDDIARRQTKPPEETGPEFRDRLHRTVIGAIVETIRTHGPISGDYVVSAAKRIVGQLRGAGFLAAPYLDPAEQTPDPAGEGVRSDGS